MPRKRLLNPRFVTISPEQTRALGCRLGAVAEAGDVFLLEGQLGSGKTVLVQGIAAGLGVTTHVTSPSFVIVNQHPGRLTLFHVDLYRAHGPDAELVATVADALDAGGVTAIEWPESLPQDLREGATVLSLSSSRDEYRLIEIKTPLQRVTRAVEAAVAERDRTATAAGAYRASGN